MLKGKYVWMSLVAFNVNLINDFADIFELNLISIKWENFKADMMYQILNMYLLHLLIDGKELKR